jgi:hypothetical protein
VSNTPGTIKTARLLATEVLLAEPEALGDDVLESCLYILRDRLRGGAAEGAAEEVELEQQHVLRHRLL